MARSVIDAIRQGNWEFEPEQPEAQQEPASVAMPGTKEKVSVLAARLQQGLPLWNPSDRQTYNDGDHE